MVCFDQLNDILRCPKRRHLRPGSRTIRGRFYRSKAKDCKQCSLAHACLPKTGKSRAIIIQDGHGALLRARRRYLITV